MARSIENVASSFIPLASGEQLDILKTIEQDAIDLSRKISRLYNEAAPDAFGREPTRD